MRFEIPHSEMDVVKLITASRCFLLIGLIIATAHAQDTPTSTTTSTAAPPSSTPAAPTGSTKSKHTLIHAIRTTNPDTADHTEINMYGNFVDAIKYNAPNVVHIETSDLNSVKTNDITTVYCHQDLQVNIQATRHVPGDGAHDLNQKNWELSINPTPEVVTRLLSGYGLDCYCVSGGEHPNIFPFILTYPYSAATGHNHVIVSHRKPVETISETIDSHIDGKVNYVVVFVPVVAGVLGLVITIIMVCVFMRRRVMVAKPSS